MKIKLLNEINRKLSILRATVKGEPCNSSDPYVQHTRGKIEAYRELLIFVKEMKDDAS